jgi:hypothetical protein
MLAFGLTLGNTDDRRPVSRLVRCLVGRPLADAGSFSAPLAEQVVLDPVCASSRNSARNRRIVFMDLSDTVLLRQRALIETIHEPLKNICQIEHTRHRSPVNFLVHRSLASAPSATRPSSRRCTATTTY